MDSETVPPPPDTPPSSPFRPEPEQPRLGILHLLVWTACVAVDFSIITAMRSDEYVPGLEPSFVLAVGLEIGRATALGGLLLLTARRYRRLSLPAQPGETLLALLGVGSAMRLGLRFLNYRMVDADATSLLLHHLLTASGMVALAVLYLAAAISDKIPRWRVCFATVALSEALRGLLHVGVMWGGWGPGRTAIGALLLVSLLPLALLLFVAMKDAVQNLRYRWTHWLGVGIGLWNGSIDAVWLAWAILLRTAFL